MTADTTPSLEMIGQFEFVLAIVAACVRDERLRHHQTAYSLCDNADVAWDQVAAEKRRAEAAEANARRLEVAARQFINHYPMGVNPFLDAAYREACAVLKSLTTKEADRD